MVSCGWWIADDSKVVRQTVGKTTHVFGGGHLCGAHAVLMSRRLLNGIHLGLCAAHAPFHKAFYKVEEKCD